MGPSGVAMPDGDLPGWRQVFCDDFSTDVAVGSWPGPYGARWGGYHEPTPDTSRNGVFTKKRTWVADSCLRFELRTGSTGSNALGGPVANVAAPTPIMPGQKVLTGQLYGRFDVCATVDPCLTGYKVAWLLWPDSNVWADGEINFPEGDLDGTIGGYVHELGSPHNNAYILPDTGRAFTDWHAYSLEWLPGRITCSLDGVQVGEYTGTSTPHVPMHWILQTETRLGARIPPDPAVTGTVSIDWVSIWSPTT